MRIRQKLKIVSEFILILTSFCCSSAAENDVSQAFRLPTNLRPENYNLIVYTDLDGQNFDYWGSVSIKVTCLQSTDKVVLNSKEITILENEVTVRLDRNNGETKIGILSHDYKKENDLYIISLSQELIVDGIYLVYIPFQATLREDMRGYYRSSYLDQNSGETRWIAVTQFEPIDARAAFPCMDQVDMKATFTITLAHAEHFIALSNMPVCRSSKKYDVVTGKTWIVDEFEESVKMSTYLVAMSINDFESENTIDQSNVKIKVWTRRDAADQVELAENSAAGSLEYYTNYFGIPYAISKLDMLAVPDFENAGMENYGLITFREIAVLFKPQETGLIFKFLVIRAICHEVCHQWVGNLVTMAWWDALWLNEGIASYFELKCSSHLLPKSNLVNYTVVTKFISVLNADAEEEAHPVSMPITDPSQIGQIFDATTYDKGSFLIRMINLFLGENIFQKGFSKYLDLYKFGNAKSDDLWKALTEEAQNTDVLPENLTIKGVMDSWILQAGGPLVTVTRDYEKKTVTVSQKRFYLNAERESDECWEIPLCFTTSRELKFDNLKTKFWLGCDGSLTFDLDLEDTEWVVFNLQLIVLAHFNYDENNWQMIRRILTNPKEYTKIDTLVRVQLVSDTTGLARAGLMDYKIAFELLTYLKHEADFLPWRKGLPVLGTYRSYFYGTDILVPYEEYVKNILVSKFIELGNINDTPDDYVQLQFKLVIDQWSCIFNVADCRNQCQNLFDQWFSVLDPDRSNPISNDFRIVVYCNAIKLGNKDHWNFLWARYEKSTLPADVEIILRSLGCSQNVETLKMLLDWSIDASKVRPQNSFTIFIGMLAYNDIGYHIAKQFWVTRFQDIYNFHKGNTSAMANYVSGIFQRTVRRKDLEDLVAFSNTVRSQLAKIEMILQRNIKTATDNVTWFENTQKSFSEIFQ